MKRSKTVFVTDDMIAYAENPKISAKELISARTQDTRSIKKIEFLYSRNKGLEIIIDTVHFKKKHCCISFQLLQISSLTQQTFIISHSFGESGIREQFQGAA